MARLLLLNKPHGVLSQFTGPEGVRTLAECVPIPGFYPAGRLDRDSEGLVLLTDDGRLQAQLSDPRYGKAKTYWVQVEGEPDDGALRHLREGLVLNDGPTRPARAEWIPPPAGLWERTPPIRMRKAIPTHWLQLTLTEGRNRQVRRMTAAVGLPTLRLIRYSVAEWTLDGIPPGHFRLVEAVPPLPSGTTDSPARKQEARRKAGFVRSR